MKFTSYARNISWTIFHLLQKWNLFPRCRYIFVDQRIYSSSINSFRDLRNRTSFRGRNQRKRGRPIVEQHNVISIAQNEIQWKSTTDVVESREDPGCPCRDPVRVDYIRPCPRNAHAPCYLACIVNVYVIKADLSSDRFCKRVFGQINRFDNTKDRPPWDIKKDKMLHRYGAGKFYELKVFYLTSEMKRVIEYIRHFLYLFENYAFNSLWLMYLSLWLFTFNKCEPNNLRN